MRNARLALLLLAGTWISSTTIAEEWFQPARTVADYRPKGPAECFRQFNIDWSWIGRGVDQLPEFLSQADPVRLAEFCREMNIDGTVVMAVPHHGYCTYDTRVGTRFPGMRGDWFGRTIEELHKRRIAAFGYITLNWNWKYMREHLGADFIEAKVKPDGSLDGMICLNAPGYVDMVEAYTREVLTRYPVDGLRYDILFTRKGCTCAGCKKLYHALYGEPLVAWRGLPEQRQHELYMATTEQAVRRLTRTGHAVKPSIVMWQNCIQSYTPNNMNLGRTQDIAYNEYGDPFRLLLLRGVLNKDAAINGLMNHTKFSATAPIDRVTFRQCLALGGRCYSYFGHKQTDYRTLLPGPEPTAWHRSQLAPFYRMVAEIEPHLRGAPPVSSVGVVYSEATRYRRPDYKREFYTGPLEQLTQAYLARSIPLEFVNCLDLCDAKKAIRRFKVLVVPLTSGLSADQLEALRRYAREGGHLLVAGDALRYDAQGREQSDFALAAELGVRFRKLDAAGKGPWSVNGQFDGRAVRAEGKSLVPVQTVEGQTLLAATQAGQQWPLVHERSMGRGKVVYLASLDRMDLVQRVVDALAGPPPVVVEPAKRRVVLTHQAQAGRWVLHLLDEGDFTVELNRELAPARKVVAQYPATGWTCRAEDTGRGLRIVVRGAAGDRLVVLE
jgi:hypothetical protein